METIGLIISSLCTFALGMYLIMVKKKTQLQKVFIMNSVLMFFCCTFLLAQKYFCANFDINPIIFEWFIYIFNSLLPVSVLFTGIIFANTKITFKRHYILLFVIPIISIVLLWTNNIHHLLYVNYSTNLDETVYGNYFSIHNTYSLILYAIRFVLFIKIFYKKLWNIFKASNLIYYSSYYSYYYKCFRFI